MSPPTPRPRSRRLLLVLSLVLNAVLVGCVLALFFVQSTTDADAFTERHYAGTSAAADKVAVIRVTGVIADSTIGYPLKQIEQAAKDKNVKAVVIRIDSPGGTVTASDQLHRAFIELRDGTATRYVQPEPKPFIVASMGSVAASGGYYVAMPAAKVVAEPTTITGSIGVFAALPNVSKLAKDHGVEVNLIKAGDIKAGGSPFQALDPAERQPWQDMVDHAYDRFLTVVSAGRPGLTREKLVSDRQVREVPKYTDRGAVEVKDGKPVTVAVTRYRADGGTFTPPQAKELGLIDDVADLPAAVKLAAELAKLGSYRAVTYERPKTLAQLLIGAEASVPTHPLSAEAVGSALSPKLWYLTPSYEAAAAVTPGQP